MLPHHSQAGTVSGGMLGTGKSIMQVQSGHLGHLLGSHEMFSADLSTPIQSHHQTIPLHSFMTPTTNQQTATRAARLQTPGSSDLIHMVTQQLL